MFPYRSMFRLLVTLSVLSLTAISLLMGVLSFITPSDYYSDPDTLDKAIFYGNALLSSELYYVDDIKSFKSRIMKNFEYRDKIAALSEEEKREMTENYYRNVSIQSKRELLPMSKPLYDIQCLNYLDKDYNVAVSIIIVYYNELSILLLRTLTTVIHRTLPKYLKEIILIDDNSEFNITGEVLKYAADHRMPLRYLRNEERLGIAGSRIRGLHEAAGDVVAILDSHMEVSELWLEPLLSAITTRPNSIVAPLLHMIQESEYDSLADIVPHPYGVQPQKGVGIITLYPYTGDNDPGRNRWEPFPSAAVLGGGLAAFKSTLLEYYPASIQGKSWGVENTRLSFRMWMCAEGAWVAPCSQVLHPNSYDWNLNRYFSDKTRDLFNKLVFESMAELINFAELDIDKEKMINKLTSDEERQQLIWDMSDDIRSGFDPDKRKCKSYDWYRREILNDYVSWESDQFDYVGEIVSVYNSKLCLEINMETVVLLYPCRVTPPTIGDNHVHGFTKNLNVRNAFRDGMCWDTATHDEGTVVKMWGCHVHSTTEGQSYNSQKFIFDKTSGQIVHPPSDRCLQYIDEKTVWLMKCNKDMQVQRWNIKMSSWF